MVATYNLSNDIGKVRLLISDKDTDNPVFQDDEISVFLSQNGNSLNLAAAEALEAWAASYAANADTEKIGDYSYAQNIVTKMLNLAKSLREKEATTPAMTWAEFNFTDAEATE